MLKRLHILNDATDEELLMMLQKNDEGAFTAIYERYHKGLYVIAYEYKRPGACKRCGTIYI